MFRTLAHTYASIQCGECRFFSLVASAMVWSTPFIDRLKSTEENDAKRLRMWHTFFSLDLVFAIFPFLLRRLSQIHESCFLDCYSRFPREQPQGKQPEGRNWVQQTTQIVLTRCTPVHYNVALIWSIKEEGFGDQDTLQMAALIIKRLPFYLHKC